MLLLSVVLGFLGGAPRLPNLALALSEHLDLLAEVVLLLHEQVDLGDQVHILLHEALVHLLVGLLRLRLLVSQRLHVL